MAGTNLDTPLSDLVSASLGLRPVEGGTQSAERVMMSFENANAMDIEYLQKAHLESQAEISVHDGWHRAMRKQANVMYRSEPCSCNTLWWDQTDDVL
jgi:hypothetical protein